MFDKILIANRGEIACRVIKSARKMGIKTVAVYSQADAAGLHVEMADEAVFIGPPPASQSYLLGEKIIEACQQTGAQAVHPGYGFLSERATFAEALAAHNITFIGPPPKAIAAMGDKIESKKLARAAGVNVVPGFVGEIADPAQAVRIAEEIGYPVMIKASAGGGGKGMRLAYSSDEVLQTFQSVRNEAKNAFGDDRVFIEKFVVEPRHIEIQVLGDKHGSLVYLGERDCSIQRRHQKVVEEAPSPFMTPELRAQMGEQAVRLAQAVGYYSAGTVEFIVGADRSFYFLEMNTRLQVEHPVTEMVTGIDLVEAMIKVAAGEKLPFGQQDIRLHGWAMETRLYAEDPYRNFLPSIGRLTTYREPPADMKGVRIDTGVVEGSQISLHYDPMIAKLITHGATREIAMDKQIAALDRYTIRGIGHNRDFLSAVMQHPRFREGARVTTGFIAEEYPQGFEGALLGPALALDFILSASIIHVLRVQQERQISGQLNSLGINGFGVNGFGVNGSSAGAPTDWVCVLEGRATNLSVCRAGEDWQVRVGTHTYPIATTWAAHHILFEAAIEDRQVAFEVSSRPLGYQLSTQGVQRVVQVLSPRGYALSRHMIEKTPPDLSRYLLCPMPGLVVSLEVKEGEAVEAGQPLAIVEAMKMQNILRAEKKGVVKAIRVQAGASLAVDAIILEFE